MLLNLHGIRTIISDLTAIGLDTLIIGVGFTLWIRYKKPPKAPYETWNKYFEQVLKDEEYDEAAMLRDLLKDKVEGDEINTPKGYKVRKKAKLDMADQYDNATFKMDYYYVIEKKKKGVFYIY